MIIWDVNKLTLRQRDVLILLSRTHSGQSTLDPTSPTFTYQLRAAKELHSIGLIVLNGEALWPDYLISLTEGGKSWLQNLDEDALITIG